MTDTDKLREDMAYVRAAADRAGSATIPSINLLWAAIVLCGCVLSDFVGDYRWIGRFWSVAGPGGLCLSCGSATAPSATPDRPISAPAFGRVCTGWRSWWPARSGPHSSLPATWSGRGSAHSWCC